MCTVFISYLLIYTVEGFLYLVIGFCVSFSEASDAPLKGFIHQV